MYVAAGRHTVLPVLVMVLFQIPMYVGLALTWKQLNPKRNKDKEMPKTQSDMDKELSTTTSTEETPVQSSKVPKEEEECDHRFDAEIEETYWMYSVRLETEL